MLSREADHGKAHAPTRQAEPVEPKPPYVFPGVRPFLDAVIEDSGRPDPHVGRDVWHVSRIQEALGQMSRMDADSRKAAMEHVHELRESLAMKLGGVDAAIAEVSSELEIPAPKAKKR